MNLRTLPPQTCLIVAIGSPDGRGRSEFAAWRRDPAQGDTLVGAFYFMSLKKFVARLKSRGWHVRIAKAGKWREIRAKAKQQPH